MGLIKHKKRNKQIVDFIGLEYGKIHPSDIDAVLEVNNQFLFLFEVKLKGTKFNKGQEILLTNIVDNWDLNSSKDYRWLTHEKKAYAIYCYHNISSTDDDILLADCKIVDVYGDGNNYFNITVKEFIEIKAKEHNIEKLLKNIENKSFIDDLINI